MQLPGPGVFGPPRDHDQAIAVLRRAIELGVDHIDTSQYYGPNVANELIREALHPYSGDLALVSKVGARRDGAGGWLPGAAARRIARRHRGPTCAARTSTDWPRSICASHGDDPSAAASRPRPFDRQLTAMINARDEGLIGGIGLSSISRDHLQIALDRTEIVRCRTPTTWPTARRSRSSTPAPTRHRLRAVLPARLGFTADNRCSAIPAVRGRLRARKTPAQIALAWTLSAAPTSADPRHVVARAPRGEPRRRRHRAARRLHPLSPFPRR